MCANRDRTGRSGLSVVLVFPSTPAVGLSSLGFAAVKALFAEHGPVETAFLPEAGPAVARESGAKLCSFDLVAFSLSFENDFANVLDMLERGGIPLYSAQRDEDHPLVVAGGVAAGLNPEPLAPFVDAFLVGEAEEIAAPLLASASRPRDRQETLLALAAEVPGAYVPSLYTPRWDASGRLSAMEPAAGAPARVRRVFARDLSSFSTVSDIGESGTGPFESSFLVEVSRGCAHGCRFCAAGQVTRPLRFRSPDQVKQDLSAARGTGRTVGLLGAAVSDLPGLEQICAYAGEQGVPLSFSSLRADAMTPEFARAVAKSGVKTATLAPDAGSGRMRRIIGKGINEEHLLSAARLLVEAGVPNLKLYFMAGLPWETTEDVDAVVETTKRVKHEFLAASRPRGRMGRIRVSLSCFVPKPHTPFQWAPMDDVRTLKDKIKRVKQGLKAVANVDVSADVPRWAYVQGLISRGDRRVADMLVRVRANSGNWPKTFKESAVNPDFFTLRERDQDEFFPWDVIDHGVDKTRLRGEYEKAKQIAEKG
ncbi:MAG: radical SAM protein [Deltaproteobacteria bacterium]|nr:radical SAM protein [Deltaproteobacteria bacterium]